MEEALLIRAVENKLLSLFAAGQMNGTVHTCVGQEFSAIAVAGQLTDDDWVTSNHRCHGHFIARTKNWKGLLDELRGLDTGVCRGIGSSQHLYAKGFLSNGLQGAFVPVAGGMALHKKRKKEPGIVVSFIGEGTLGEGVFYEAMNLSSALKLPHLIVCENNLYSQSTPQHVALAGDIAARARAFDMKVFEADTWHVSDLFSVSRDALTYVRGSGLPAFLIIRTYRLNAHSKGDDDRAPEEIAFFQNHDPLSLLLVDPTWSSINARIVMEVDAHVASTPSVVMPLHEYLRDQLPSTATSGISPVVNRKVRMVQALNQAYRKTLEKGAVHIGEDVHDPYGGAFKVTKGLMDAFPDAVFTTSISEAGLVGLATGLALMGTPAWAEIMFGDFMTNVFDQIINNLSKINHMYAFQASAPARIRTPMGGKRGYGPTHSQSLEKFLVGIDNVTAIYLSSLVDPGEAIGDIENFAGPVVVFENKIDYGKFLWPGSEDLETFKESRPAGSLVISPRRAKPTVTVVSYGETAREIADNIQKIFVETDLVPELVVLQMLHPLDTALLERSLEGTGHLVIVEDGSTCFGIGGEIVARLIERGIKWNQTLRIGADPVPIPSASSLELDVLPTVKKIIRKLSQPQVRCG